MCVGKWRIALYTVISSRVCVPSGSEGEQPDHVVRIRNLTVVPQIKHQATLQCSGMSHNGVHSSAGILFDNHHGLRWTHPGYNRLRSRPVWGCQELVPLLDIDLLPGHPLVWSKAREGWQVGGRWNCKQGKAWVSDVWLYRDAARAVHNSLGALTTCDSVTCSLSSQGKICVPPQRNLRSNMLLRSYSRRGQCKRAVECHCYTQSPHTHYASLASSHQTCHRRHRAVSCNNLEGEPVPPANTSLSCLGRDPLLGVLHWNLPHPKNQIHERWFMLHLNNTCMQHLPSKCALLV